MSVALEVIEKNFPEQLKQWEPKLKEIIPSYGQSLIEDYALLKQIRQASNAELELNHK